ncbi:solute carrier family 15 member 2-like [Contarinia nasturtii]|uniref:solute carrier family 15 member 2-like n=1 Tax=Contarinia nasturtii TaxID=265458 RepID=UPI0012D3B8B2|nr:solute carrier family 15 member 2-like [Contarinia nasturtii]
MHNSSEQTLNDESCQGSATNSVSNIENAEPQKLAYPKRVFLIIGNEFCERFNYHGMKAILAFYLRFKLGFTENDATVLYHAFVTLVYFTCIIGAVLSDVWLGKFKTILYLSILYVIGSTIVALGAIPAIAISPIVALYIGLTLITIGSGGIKPCVGPFGGDQFKLPEQTAQMATYFSMFYFAFDSGAFISTLITPILRSDVHCFGENDCYSLAFGVPVLLMIISILLFIIGKSSYTYVQTSSENILMKMLKCIWNAMIIKRRQGKTKPRKNLLDYSIEKYGAQLVNETRAILKIFTLYLPLPFFWALLMQTGSRWTFQANRMNGDLGFYTIKADQIQMLEALLVLTFVPLCDIFIYPGLGKIGIRRPLQRLTFAGFFGVISFVLSASLQYWIESMPLNSVNMLWQIPQYIMLSLAEAMAGVTGLSFSYEQAPKSMKSIVFTFWYLQMAFGNIIVMFIVGMDLFDSRTYEFLFSASLTFCSMLAFSILVYNYERFKTTETH